MYWFSFSSPSPFITYPFIRNDVVKALFSGVHIFVRVMYYLTIFIIFFFVPFLSSAMRYFRFIFFCSRVFGVYFCLCYPLVYSLPLFFFLLSPAVQLQFSSFPFVLLRCLLLFILPFSLFIAFALTYVYKSSALIPFPSVYFSLIFVFQSSFIKFTDLYFTTSLPRPIHNVPRSVMLFVVLFF